MANKLYIIQDGTLDGDAIINKLVDYGGAENPYEWNGNIDEDEEAAVFYINADNEIESEYAADALCDLIDKGYKEISI